MAFKSNNCALAKFVISEFLVVIAKRTITAMYGKF